jgi:molybdopterin converting factor small subunit
MLVHVTLYGALRVIAGRQMLDMSFDEQHITMMQLLEALTTIYPRIGPYLIDHSSQTLHTEMRILLNGTRPQPGLTLSTPLYDNDRLTFLVANH